MEISKLIGTATWENKGVRPIYIPRYIACAATRLAQQGGVCESASVRPPHPLKGQELRTEMGGKQGTVGGKAQTLEFTIM